MPAEVQYQNSQITALWCSRNSSLGSSDGFDGIEKEGFTAALNHYGYRSAVIIGSRLVHYSIKKAADVLGIGERGLLCPHADHNDRIELAALKNAIRECLAKNVHILAVVGNAGTTDCGSMDRLADMADIAHESGLHFHVDAAWGGPLLFSEHHRHKLAGIEKADSVTIDGHKQLYLPLGIGIVMLRNAELAKAIEKQARYIVRHGSVDLGKRSMEGSRPAAALFLHAALKITGRKGYGFLIDENIRKTQYMSERVHSLPQFKLLANPEMNIIVYRYIPERWITKASIGKLTETGNALINHFNERLQKVQRQAGQSFVSRTTLETTRYGRDVPIVALRAVVANPLTTEDDLDAVLNDQMELATKLQATKADLGSTPRGGEAYDV